MLQLSLMGDHDVSLINDKLQEFRVKFKGPKDTPFEGGTWKIHVELPDQYPYKSPSIGFENKIYHPNIDETSGSVCLDVINQTWSPMFDISNIFDTFLPQLLTYPNPSDPLNGDAASLMNLDKTAYENKIREYVKKYANDPNVKISDEDEADEDADDDEDEELSDVSSMDEDDDEDEDAMEDD
ncbi:hypothetical protein WICPIJ_001859 [Wickerhamomyces pijperi]|uniref:UBC core domain-containing protein n=1 Tax=Wickerhamomyces pijperi TaxID=599730 RepID=A0A9P8QCX9_WICPI|nr:hypothetical protein WICPIJ_001859 [Wickerhamomyces pijperi]